MTARRLDPELRHRNYCDGRAPLERPRNGNAGWKEECSTCGAYAVARPFWADGIDEDRRREPLPMLDAAYTGTAAEAGFKVWRYDRATGNYEIKE